jgi:choline dehydrogenase-like flavoprotein
LTAGALAQFVDSDSHVYQLVIRTEQAPNRDNRVTLNDDKDALGVPIADLHWTVGELENATFDALFASLAMATGQADLGRTNEDVDERNKVTGGPHHMGTTRMAADPKDGVVDADCKVFGIDNLWVAGSSVFPTSGWANPTLTLVALADRLAGHLLSR